MTVDSVRFEFGRNWSEFSKQIEDDNLRHAVIGVKKLLPDNLDPRGKSFLDIGSGSGLHSAAACRLNFASVTATDYDEESVETTKQTAMRFGTPIHAFRDDILNSKLTGLYDVVYSWGVLHHTGNMWAAIDKAARLVAPGGIFILALYSSNVATPSTEFWLDAKRRYNAASPSGKRRMEWWYVWRFGAGYGNPLRVSVLLYQVWKKRKQRGMRYMTDVRDWLGGWPMEYADDHEVVETLKNKFGMDLEKIFTGEACTEFTFRLRP